MFCGCPISLARSSPAAVTRRASSSDTVPCEAVVVAIDRSPLVLCEGGQRLAPRWPGQDPTTLVQPSSHAYLWVGVQRLVDAAGGAHPPHGVVDRHVLV